MGHPEESQVIYGWSRVYTTDVQTQSKHMLPVAYIFVSHFQGEMRWCLWSRSTWLILSSSSTSESSSHPSVKEGRLTVTRLFMLIQSSQQKANMTVETLFKTVLALCLSRLISIQKALLRAGEIKQLTISLNMHITIKWHAGSIVDALWQCFILLGVHHFFCAFGRFSPRKMSNSFNRLHAVSYDSSDIFF